MLESKTTGTRYHLGIDGCHAGWICIALADEGHWSIELATCTRELAALAQAARLALIDIPIGLLDGGREERQCDRAARALLGRPRASSVFRAPARAALGATDYAEANTLNRRATGVGLSRQSFGILAKIREVDALLRGEPTLRARLRESHPEVCFQALNADHAMAHNKKTPAGRAERHKVLAHQLAQSEAVIAAALSRYRRAWVGADDILDALVLAVGARLSDRQAGPVPTLPTTPPCDALGLRMEIVRPEPRR